MGGLPPAGSQGDSGQPPSWGWAHPATAVAGPGRHNPPLPSARSRTKRVRLIGAAAVVVLAAIAVTSVVHATERRVFTYLPTDGCSLVEQETIDFYIRRAATTCEQDFAYEASDGGNVSGRLVRWAIQRNLNSLAGPWASIMLDLQVVGDSLWGWRSWFGSSAPSKIFAKYKADALKDHPSKIQDQRAVAGLGDEAFVLYSLNPYNPETEGQAQVVVRLANAAFKVTYSGGVPLGNLKYAPVSQKDAEAAAIAIAKDVLGHS